MYQELPFYELLWKVGIGLMILFVIAVVLAVVFEVLRQKALSALSEEDRNHSPRHSAYTNMKEVLDGSESPRQAD